MSSLNELGLDDPDHCVYCEGFNRHEAWCLTQNAGVQYAYRAVVEPEMLDFTDQLKLHALGVAWATDIVWPKPERTV